LIALLVDRHKRGRLRHRGGYSDLLERNRLDPKVYQDSQKINGIKFHYYIDTETKGVTNVHPK